MYDQKQFEVIITETLQKHVMVTAKNKEEAEQTVADEYFKQQIHVLDASHFTEVTFLTNIT